MDLQPLAGDLLGHLGGEVLDHRRLLVAAPPAVDLLGHEVEQLATGLDLSGHLGQLEADGLELANRLAELLAGLGVD